MRFVFAPSESRDFTALVSTSLPRATRAFEITNASPSAAPRPVRRYPTLLKCGTCQPAPQLPTRTSPSAISTGAQGGRCDKAVPCSARPARPRTSDGRPPGRRGCG